MAASYQVESAVQRVHRRSLAIIGAGQAALAASLILGALALVLAFGTRLLSWPWVISLIVIALAASLFRLRGRVPKPYQSAQLLDRRMHLPDTVSTAWHVIHDGKLAETIPGRFQVGQAAKALQDLNPAQSFPFSLKPWSTPLAVGAVALTLLTVRYMQHGGIDFKRSLVPLPVPSSAAARNPSAAAAKDRDGRNDVPVREAGELQSAPSQGSKTNNDVRDQQLSGPTLDNPDGLPPQMTAEMESQGKQAAPNSQTGDNPSGGPDSPSSPSGKEISNRDAKDSEGADQHTGGNSQSARSQTLMNRMKDAMSSLMSKMKPSEKGRQGSQSNMRNAAAPDQDENKMESSQSSNQTRAPQSQQNSSSTDAKNNQQGQAMEMSQPAQSQTASSSEHAGSDQSKSGIGKQDGAKEVSAAEAQRAMGKLAEIIGKRSQEVSGEMTVETPSGKEQLRTAYSGKVVEHTDSGGEIDRDEIPVAYQEYIRAYMDRVHREAQAAKK